METQFKRALVVSSLLASASLFSLSPLHAEDQVDSPHSVVQQLLAKESLGAVVDRRDLAKQVDDKEARWHAGELQVGGRWMSVDQLEDVPAKELEYQRLRSELNDDAEGNRKLAKWCHRNNLDLQARAHWNAVIEKSPNDIEARRQLGHQWIEDAWYSENEIKAAASASQEQLRALKQWNGQVAKILNGLKDKDTAEKQKAIRKLNQIDDPVPYPAWKWLPCRPITMLPSC